MNLPELPNAPGDCAEHRTRRDPHRLEQHTVVLPRSSNHRSCLRSSGGERLLADDVQPVAEAHERLREVARVRGRDVHCVDLSARAHCVDTVVAVREAVARGEALCGGELARENSGDSNAGNAAARIDELVCDPSGANDAKANRHLENESDCRLYGSDINSFCSKRKIDEFNE